MPSPDWSQYADLTVYDQTATEILEESLNQARVALPEWVPEVGQIEVTILEAVATQVANLVAAVNRLPGKILETLLTLFGVERDDGEFATGSITATAIDDAGYVVPSGTHLVWSDPSGTGALSYYLTEDLAFQAGSTSASATIAAASPGPQFNAPEVGDVVQILSNVSYLASVEMLSKPTGGKNAESDQEYFDRAVTTLASYSSALVTAEQAKNYVLLNYDDDVYRCMAYDRRRVRDRDQTSVTYSEHPGYMLVVVAGENASPDDTSDTAVPIEIRDTIHDDLHNRVCGQAEVEVFQAELAQVDVTATVKKVSSYSTTVVENAIEEALNLYLSPNSWDWDRFVRYTEIVSEVNAVEGVDYIETLTLSSPTSFVQTSGDDLDLVRLGVLTRPGTLTITVT